MKRLFSLALCLALLAVLCAGAFAEERTYPDYLNLESSEPIIKDEYAGTVKIKLMIVQDSTGGDWDDLWISRYLKERYNVEFEIEPVLNTALDEKKSLMFATGDLPDMIWGAGLTNADLMLYGMQEGLLYPIDTAMNEELCPNICKYLSREDIARSVTTPDGHIYTLPQIINDQDEGSYPRLFLNRAKMTEMGFEELPRTLDEFNELIYAFKELDPENNFPIGGGMEVKQNAFFLLNALGYTSQYTMNYGEKPALRNGEVVIPAYDTEVFSEYLALMNRYYRDGIINPNYFTMEDTETIAQLNNGQTLLYAEPVYVTGLTTWSDWEAPYPLTSEWNETPQWSRPSFSRIGGCVISAKTEYIDLCLRICDLYFSEDSRLLWAGPAPDSEWTFGYYFAELTDDGKTEKWDSSKLPDGLDLWTYLMQRTAGFMPPFGALEDMPSIARSVESRGGHFEKSFDITQPDPQYRISVYSNLVPYGIDTYPTQFFLSEEDTNRLTDLQTMIEPYIQEQVALFITGARPLEQVDAFKGELEAMGVQDLLQMYQTIYNG